MNCATGYFRVSADGISGGPVRDVVASQMNPDSAVRVGMAIPAAIRFNPF